MNIGYIRTISRKKTTTHQADALIAAGAETIIQETVVARNIINDSHSDFQQMVKTLSNRDCLFVLSLDTISKNYQSLIDCLNELQRKGAALVVINLPEQSLADILLFLKWAIKNETDRQPRVLSVGKETPNELKLYAFNSKDPEGKATYKKIVALLRSKHSLREIAKKTGVSRATVFRIKKQQEKLKATGWIGIIFIVTVLSLIAAQTFSSNVLIQIGICAISTILIVYLSYTDIQNE